jgi:hypothetical protein
MGHEPEIADRSLPGWLPVVEQTEPGESGLTAAELPVSGVLLSRPVASRIVSC